VKFDGAIFSDNTDYSVFREIFQIAEINKL
jgi:hypothetical protein